MYENHSIGEPLFVIIAFYISIRQNKIVKYIYPVIFFFLFLFIYLFSTPPMYACVTQGNGCDDNAPSDFCCSTNSQNQYLICANYDPAIGTAGSCQPQSPGSNCQGVGGTVDNTGTQTQSSNACCATDNGRTTGQVLTEKDPNADKTTCVVASTSNTPCATAGQACADAGNIGFVNKPLCCTVDKSNNPTNLQCIGATDAGTQSQAGKCNVPTPGVDCASLNQACNGSGGKSCCATDPKTNQRLTCSGGYSAGTCIVNQPSGVPTLASIQNPCPGNICQTAIGAIDVLNGTAFVTILFRIILSLSGGLALALIIYSGFSMTMSQGNAEKVKGAQETLTSAIIGLVFIIISIAILQIIGVDVLQLPGFHQGT